MYLHIDVCKLDNKISIVEQLMENLKIQTDLLADWFPVYSDSRRCKALVYGQSTDAAVDVQRP